jgi:hypothetical protein
MKLSHTVSITVPSTMGLSEPIVNTEYALAVAKKLAVLFGGSRIIDNIQGLYISDNGTEVIEKNTDIIAYCETLTDEQVEEVIKIALELKSQMNQESILYSIDNIAYIE